MKVQYYNVIVGRDANTRLPRAIAAWELPVLQELHGEAEVEVVDEFVHDFDVLSPADEYARLMKVFGKAGDEESGYFPAVDLAYGKGKLGIRRLEREMAGAIVNGEPRKKPGPKPKAETQSDLEA